MDRKEMKEYKQRVQARADIEQDAYDVSGSFYTVTLDAPPHPHTVVGVAVGAARPSAMEAVVSMQEYARGSALTACWAWRYAPIRKGREGSAATSALRGSSRTGPPCAGLQRSDVDCGRPSA